MRGLYHGNQAFSATAISDFVVNERGHVNNFGRRSLRKDVGNVVGNRRTVEKSGYFKSAFEAVEDFATPLDDELPFGATRGAALLQRHYLFYSAICEAGNQKLYGITFADNKIDAAQDYLARIFDVRIEPSLIVATRIRTCSADGRSIRMPCKL